MNEYSSAALSQGQSAFFSHKTRKKPPIQKKIITFVTTNHALLTIKTEINQWTKSKNLM